MLLTPLVVGFCEADSDVFVLPTVVTALFTVLLAAPYVNADDMDVDTAADVTAAEVTAADEVETDAADNVVKLEVVVVELPVKMRKMLSISVYMNKQTIEVLLFPSKINLLA